MTIEQLILKRHKQENEWHKPQLGVYHASGLYDIIHGTVKPENFFKQQALDEKTIHTFWIGTMYHEAIQRLVIRIGENPTDKHQAVDIEKRVQLIIPRDPVVASENELIIIIVGSVDLIHNQHVLELKTCSTLPAKPYPGHKLQTQLYMKATGLPGVITYILKHPTQVVTRNFKVEPMTENEWQEVCASLTEFDSKLRKLNPSMP